MKIREATRADAAEISQMLQDMAALGKRSLPSDVGFVIDSYLTHPDLIRCSLAVDNSGAILGLQILKRVGAGNPYGVTPGWGIIGTHVHPRAARQGVGRALLASSRKAATEAGLRKIDATIGAANAEGLGYYAAMGFRSYRRRGDKICKCLDLS